MRFLLPFLLLAACSAPNPYAGTYYRSDGTTFVVLDNLTSPDFSALYGGSLDCPLSFQEVYVGFIQTDNADILCDPQNLAGNVNEYGRLTARSVSIRFTSDVQVEILGTIELTMYSKDGSILYTDVRYVSSAGVKIK